MGRSCSKEFASNYMLLNPENLGFVDLFYMIFSKDLNNRSFIECSEGTREESCSRRWIIFASIVAQKLLFLLAKPLARFGSKVEYWLNLVSSNGGFFGLVQNYLRGWLLSLLSFMYKYSFCHMNFYVRNAEPLYNPGVYVEF